MNVSKKFLVRFPVGLHARPAANFVRTAVSLKENSILIENLSKSTATVNAKSFTSVLSISAEQNDEILITIEGENGEEAMELFTDLFEAGSGE